MNPKEENEKTYFCNDRDVYLYVNPAMANQGCAIDDGNENIVDDMPVDPTPSKMNWLVLKTNYKGYEIKAVFTDKTSEDAIISATKDGVVMSAAGIQLALKDASGTAFVVTCGN